MTIGFSTFLQELFANPVMFVTVLVILGVILVNGLTDAPNAIATAVSTRAMTMKAAVIMAAVLNFAGVLVSTLLSATVAQTIFNMVDFHGDNHESIVALCAAMVAIVLWAVTAWRFGIPTSESHALIAGLSGAAIALQNGFSGINGGEWIKVIYGLVLSVFLGFFLGWFLTRLLEFLFRRANRTRANNFFRRSQVFGAAAMAFMHGAQDGQKFLAVFMLGIVLNRGSAEIEAFQIPFWMILTCSLVMALGTSIGGTRIIKSVGMDMVKLSPHQGFAADLGGALSLLAAQVLSFPVSTTHTKTTAIMGVGAAKRLSTVNWTIVKEMVFAWVMTFPGCGLVGFAMAKLFMWLF